MKLTIITGVNNHGEVENLIRSIDENTQIILVFNHATRKIKQKVRKLAKHDKRIEIIEVPHKSLGEIKNAGLKHASYNNILFVDADITFKQGTVRKFYNALQKHRICKGVIKISPKTYIGKIVAMCRLSAKPKAYTPGLAVRKNFLKKLGNFDDSLYWREDYQLDQRLRKTGVQIKYLPNAIMDHPETFMYHDLRTAFRCGTGHRIGIKKGLLDDDIWYGGGTTLIESVLFDIKRLFYLPKMFCTWAKMFKRPDACLYMLLWRFIFSVGYYAQEMFGVQGVENGQ